MKSIPNNLRFHLGNFLGYIFYIFSGKKILLQKIDNSKGFIHLLSQSISLCIRIYNQMVA